jgi:hypothetical protein
MKTDQMQEKYLQEIEEGKREEGMWLFWFFIWVKVFLIQDKYLY